MLRSRLIGVFTVFVFLGLCSPLEAAERAKFLMGISENDIRTTSGLMMTKLYPEAFRRLGMSVEITSVPLSRLTLMVENGELDGEISRVKEYGVDHPQLVRVEEAVTDLSFSVFGTNVNPSGTETFQTLAKKKVKMAYRRGVGVCEKAIESAMPPQLLLDLNTTEQGLKQLKAGRVNYFCDITETVEFFLSLPDYSGKPKIEKSFDVGQSIPTYPYVNPKYKSLAPRLAQVLKEMKKEGLFEQYRKEADQTLRAKWIK